MKSEILLTLGYYKCVYVDKGTSIKWKCPCKPCPSDRLVCMYIKPVTMKWIDWAMRLRIHWEHWKLDERKLWRESVRELTNIDANTAMYVWNEQIIRSYKITNSVISKCKCMKQPAKMMVSSIVSGEFDQDLMLQTPFPGQDLVLQTPFPNFYSQYTQNFWIKLYSHFYLDAEVLYNWSFPWLSLISFFGSI